MGRKRKYGIFTIHKNAGEAIGEAVGEVEALHDEMEEWVSNMEQSEGLMATTKYEEVTEARDGLYDAKDYANAIDQDFITAHLEELILRELRHRKTPRHARCSNAIEIFVTIKDELDNMKEDPDTAQGLIEKIEESIDQIEDAITALENVSFPGMY